MACIFCFTLLSFFFFSSFVLLSYEVEYLTRTGVECDGAAHVGE